MNKQTTQRLFFALEIDKVSAHKVIDIITQLRYEDNDNYFRWTPSENLHVTIRFLGNLTAKEQSIYINAVQQSISDAQTFHINTTELISIPTNRHPHLIALAIENNQHLEKLFHTVNNAVENLGIPEEKHGFLPHITLGRTKKHPEEIFKLLKKNIVCECIKININKLALYKSSPAVGRVGTVYTEVDALKF